MYESLELKHLVWGGNLGGGGGKIFRPMKMLLFAIIIVFLTFIGMGVKISKWGKNSLVGVKILQVGPNEAVKCVGSNA